jgi:CheY-like chemotaxis protein
MRILIVEDEPRMLELLCKRLYEHGHTASININPNRVTVRRVIVTIIDSSPKALTDYGELFEEPAERNRL